MDSSIEMSDTLLRTNFTFVLFVLIWSVRLVETFSLFNLKALEISYILSLHVITVITVS